MRGHFVSCCASVFTSVVIFVGCEFSSSDNSGDANSAPVQQDTKSSAVSGHSAIDARQILSQALKSVFTDYRDKESGRVFMDASGYIFEVSSQDKQPHLQLIGEWNRADSRRSNNFEEQVLSAMAQNVVAQYKFQPQGIKVRGKKFASMDDFPYLFPWSTWLDYAEVFPPFVVTYYLEEGKLYSSYSTFAGANVLIEKGIDHLLNRDSVKHLSALGKDAHREFYMQVSKCTRLMRGSLFVASASTGPAYNNANRADSANEALNWRERYPQNTLITLREIAGKRQLMIQEQEISQTNKINGVLAQGEAAYAFRGFHRSASIAVQTPDGRPEDLRLDVKQEWGDWKAPEMFKGRWKYQVMADGTVHWNRLYVWDQHINRQALIPSSGETPPIQTYGLSEKTFDRLFFSFREYTKPDLPDEDTMNLNEKMLSLWREPP